ncbi:Magnetic particle membrane specific GTPase P16 (modular protein) [Candidatus Terasakiella magnetica]|nr:Magnetic particle membrane specific GTPase P16 (modular protein) [Candidatus Terasakiella magnetica]
MSTPPKTKPTPAKTVATAKTAAPAPAPVAAKVATPAPVAEAVKTIEEAVTVSKETIETVVKASADVAAKGYDKAVAASKEQVESVVKAQTAAFKGYEDALSFGKDNIEAVVQAGNIFTKGLQDLGTAVVAMTQAAIEENVAASKALLGTKSLREFIEVQASLSKAGVDKLVTESSRLSEQSVKLLEQALAPINSRVNATVDKLVKAAA